MTTPDPSPGSSRCHSEWQGIFPASPGVSVTAPAPAAVPNPEHEAVAVPATVATPGFGAGPCPWGLEPVPPWGALVSERGREVMV